MAYYLKYYHDIDRDGLTYRLAIYVRDTYPGVAKKICNLVDWRVGFVGTNNPDDPITKTEMQISLVDAPDGHYASNEKGSNWIEFYTQDPTLYKVELEEYNDEEYSLVRWTGYITPDSWSEQLRYNGVISITARDNIGHLKDFDFAYDGHFLYFDDLLRECEELSGQYIDYGNSVFNLRGWFDQDGSSGNTEFTNLHINTDAFEDKTWYDVLEAFLLAFGFVLRWFDWGVFGICPIGWLKTETFSGELTRNNKVAEFVNESGEHTLNPMYKQLRETIDYDYYDDNEDDIERRSFTAGENGSPTTSALGYMGCDETKADNAFCICFGYTTGAAGYYIEREFRMPANTQFDLSFGIMGGYYFKNLPYDVLPASLSYFAANITVRFSLIWEDLHYNRKYLSMNSGWVTTEQILTASGTSSSEKATTAYNLHRTTPGTLGRMILRIYSVAGPISSSSDRYFGLINDMKLSYTISSKVKKHTVTTVNNEKANLKMDRKDDIGQFVGSPDIASCVKNIIFAQNILPLSGLSKASDDSPRYQTTFEFIHRNLLCCYLDTTSILEGELRDKTQNRPFFSDVWLYPFQDGYKKFILTGGRLNLLTGRIESAVLREVANFTDLFPEYRLHAYTVEILSWTANDSGSYADFDGEQRIGLHFVNTSTSRITLHCKISTPEASWCKPLLEARIYQSHSLWRTISCLAYDPNDKAGSWTFDVQLRYGDVDERDCELSIGPAAIKVYDEQGYSYEELPTYGGDRDIVEI